MKTTEMSSDNRFLDNLGNLKVISICLVKENWDAYSVQSGWDSSLVGHLDVSGGELMIHGVSICGQMLQQLSNYLYKYKCRVNRNGFSIYSDTKGCSRRLNEMFPWYKYGVQPRFNNVCNRLELSNDKKTILGSHGESSVVATIKAELEALKKKNLELNKLVQAKDKILKGKEEELIKKDKIIQVLKNTVNVLTN